MTEECGSRGCGPKGGVPTASVPAPASDGRPGTTLRVAGMDCPDEIAAIERVLKPLAGVGQIKVNLMAGSATIAHDHRVTAKQLIHAIGTAGLKASTMDGSEGDDKHEKGSVPLIDNP